MVRHRGFQVVTYGMVWHWLVKGGREARDKLFDENCAFLLDEFSGRAEGGDPQELTADPQIIEIASLPQGSGAIGAQRTTRNERD